MEYLIHRLQQQYSFIIQENNKIISSGYKTAMYLLKFPN